jgi:hypothetical protein
MSTTATILLTVVIAAVAVALVWFFKKQRSTRLHGHFGPEYDRTVKQLGDRQKAESELERRAKRVETFHIHGIPAEERTQFAEKWRVEQSRFVDQPEQAVAEAHRLVNEVMRARGYPVSAQFEQNAADLSVDHPSVVEHYRVACKIASRRENGEANTEDLRAAMVHYRDLFEELLGSRVNEREEVRR